MNKDRKQQKNETFKTFVRNYYIRYIRVGNQSVREKLGVQEIVRETEHYQKSGYNTYTEWSETGYPSRHCSINRKAGRPRK